MFLVCVGMCFLLCGLLCAVSVVACCPLCGVRCLLFGVGSLRLIFFIGCNVLVGACCLLFNWLLRVERWPSLVDRLLLRVACLLVVH